jgi:hypothetical protein
MPSFYIDMKSGRGQTEVDALNGAVRRYGEKLGVPTPVNRLLCETLTALASGALPVGDYTRNPEKLLKSLKSHAQFMNQTNVQTEQQNWMYRINRIERNRTDFSPILPRCIFNLLQM